MASTNKTANLGLSQWEASDPFSREDINGDFRKIDAIMSDYLPEKLLDYTVEEQTQSVTFDLSDKNLDQFREIVFYADMNQSKDMRVNGVDTNSYNKVSPSSDGGLRNYILLNPGKSRMSVTRKRLVYDTDFDYSTTLMERTNFPSIRTFLVYGTEKNLLSVGERICIWGIRK